MSISQIGSDLYINLQNRLYSGLGIDNAQKATKGEIAFTLCEGTPEPLSTSTGHASITIRPRSGLALFKGDLVFGNTTDDTVGTCKLVFKRTDTVDPNLGPCP